MLRLLECVTRYGLRYYSKINREMVNQPGTGCAKIGTTMAYYSTTRTGLMKPLTNPLATIPKPVPGFVQHPVSQRK